MRRILHSGITKIPITSSSILFTAALPITRQVFLYNTDLRRDTRRILHAGITKIPITYYPTSPPVQHRPPPRHEKNTAPGNYQAPDNLLPDPISTTHVVLLYNTDLRQEHEKNSARGNYQDPDKLLPDCISKPHTSSCTTQISAETREEYCLRELHRPPPRHEKNTARGNYQDPDNLLPDCISTVTRHVHLYNTDLRETREEYCTRELSRSR
jgi:hypothetical protein